MTMQENNKMDEARSLMSIQGFGLWSNLGRTKIHHLIATGELRAVKCGRRTLIPIEEATRWRNALPTAR